MGLETGSFISALVSTNPVGATDPKSQGDDHLRFIKAKLLETFPNVTGAVTSTHLELNLVDGATQGLATLSVSFAALHTLVGQMGTLSSSVTSSDITGSIRNPVLTATGASAGTYTAATVVIDAKGRVLSAVAGQSGITLRTAQATTSGTTIDFTSIPAGTKRITVMLKGVSHNGTSVMIVRLGTGGTPTTTGYVSFGEGMAGASMTAFGFTSGFALSETYAAARVYDGQLIFNHMGSNTWTMSGAGALTGDSYTGSTCGGSVTLSGELDMLRLTSVSGDTFDAGSINISYE
jgi:hypothetical protein